jgi:hypothetical protein
VYLNVNDDYDYDNGGDDYDDYSNNNNNNNNNTRFTIIHTFISLSEKQNTPRRFI